MSLLSPASFRRLLGSNPPLPPVLSDGFVTAALLFCRNGQQIDFLLVDENYNFELQQTVRLGNIRTIKQVDPNCHIYLCLIVVWYCLSKTL